MDRAEQWIAPTDGGSGLEGWVRANFARVEAVILDFYHAAEYLGGLARTLFPGDDESRKGWLGDWCHRLKHEGGPAVLEALRDLEVRGRVAKEARAEVVPYFTNQAHRMDDPGDVARGWAIGSGPVEAACKTVVGQRMKGAGMRWGADGADAACHLRALFQGREPAVGRLLVPLAELIPPTHETPTLVAKRDWPPPSRPIDWMAGRTPGSSPSPDPPASGVQPNMWGVYQDRGIRFEYPPDWEIEVTDDGPSQTTVALQSPGGTAFALVRLDEDRPAPAGLADEALAAMRDEYPSLDASPAMETIDGRHAVGHDVEFLSMDIANSCSIRCFRTDRRTVFVFGQWSDLDGEEPEALLKVLRGSIEETDSLDALGLG